MKRSKFSLSHYKLLTCDMGELVPIACIDVLPGDTMQHATSLLLRCSPLLAPVMHPVQVRVHHWFVPYRLLWDNWENFITGGPDNDSAPDFPVFNDISVTEGSLADYLGIPPVNVGSAFPAAGVSALPFRAYALIWNEWYRDQDLQTPLAMVKTDGVDITTNRDLQNVGWEKDYFTTARPWTQKGAEVNVPLGGTIPIVASDDPEPQFSVVGGGSNLGLVQGDDAGVFRLGLAGGLGPAAAVQWGANTGLEGDLSQATVVGINELREAFALQRYAEARARYGSRYTEYLRYLGVRSSDARLQRPEYLGGGKQTIQFSEVLQTGVQPLGAEEYGGVGNMLGHGISAMRSNRYRRFFEEHGVVISLLSVKPKTMYADGVPRHFMRRTKEEFFQRELQHIGQQEIFNWEIRAAHNEPEGVFGYQDRYDEYRRCESGIAGDFRDTLNFWHYARQFAADPALNADFVKSVPTKRVNAVQNMDVLWCMTNHNIQARRLVQGKANSFIY